jgi:hypothetical protein
VRLVIRVLTPIVIACAVLSTVVACGGSSGPGQSGIPSVKFVGNSTCPTAGASAYSPSPPNVNSMPPVGEAIDEMPHTHVNPPAKVTYEHNPPTSGCHYNLGYGNAPIPAGAYDRAIDAEYWIHNLEHGYIAILYNCPTGCAPQFQQLRTWLHGLSPDPNFGYAKVIVIPWTSMAVPFAAVAWDWYDPIPNFSIDEVQKFYANHVGQGPEPNGP